MNFNKNPQISLKKQSKPGFWNFYCSFKTNYKDNSLK